MRHNTFSSLQATGLRVKETCSELGTTTQTYLPLALTLPGPSFNYCCSNLRRHNYLEKQYPAVKADFRNCSHHEVIQMPSIKKAKMYKDSNAGSSGWHFSAPLLPSKTWLQILKHRTWRLSVRAGGRHWEQMLVGHGAWFVQPGKNVEKSVNWGQIRSAKNKRTTPWWQPLLLNFKHKQL